jgi:tRNA-guanine family transglycosylase
MAVRGIQQVCRRIRSGIDMFDCVPPTRNGRHGVAFTRHGPIRLKNTRHADDQRPLDETSACAAGRFAEFHAATTAGWDRGELPPNSNSITGSLDATPPADAK